MKKKILVLGTVATVTISSAFFGESAFAEPQTLDEVKTKQQEVHSKLSKAESKIADILTEIKEINEEIQTLQYALDENENQIKKTEEQIETLEKEIDELNEKIEARNEIIKNRISSYQENGGNIQFLDVILGAEGFTDFISRVSTATTLTNADMDLIAENEKDKETVQVKLDEQEDAKAELQLQKDTIETQKKEQEENKKALKAKEEKLKKEKAELESESSELKAFESQIRAQMAAPAPVVTVAESSSNNSNDSGNSNNSSKSNSGSNKNVAYTGTGKSAIAAGQTVLGTPYVYGGTSTSGFDCSGFVRWAYAHEGISLPRTSSAQAGVGTTVSKSNLQAGDLVFFNTTGRGISHVGIYVGNGKFLGAQSSGGVSYASINDSYWGPKYVTAKRVK